ncbi:MAG: MMPL family transporter [Mycobacterium sp.]|nr:MAG: MMPL family transporter [Mycobacterium sp.]
MIGFWVALAAVLSLTVPSLDEMSRRHPVAILPADAPSAVATRQMAEAFHESGSDNVLLVLLTDEKGLGPDDEATYRKLVDALRGDASDVVMLRDFLTAPPLQQALTSKDNTSWIVPVGLAGELGTPTSYGAYTRVADLVRHTVAGSALTAHLTGPAATVADLTKAGEQDRLPIELAIVVLVLAVLLVIYRNPVAMLLPLMTIGISVVTAQAVVAGFSHLSGLGVSNQAIIFLGAMVTGAGTDYAVFVVSRYHDYVRLGADCDEAVTRSLISVGKVIAASAATVGITFLGMSFARLGVFKTVGAASAIGIGVAFLAAVTFLPAVLVLAGPRGWIRPRRELTARAWRRSGVRIVRRPRVHLAASVAVLVLLAGCAGLARYNYDDRKALPSAAESSRGYAALDRHFPVNQSIPEYLVVHSAHDLRTPAALADLEQMAARVSQLPDIAVVSGITRPTGAVPEQLRATYQAGTIGGRLGGASTVISDDSDDLDRLADGANTLADNLVEVRGQVNQAVYSVRDLVEVLTALQTQFGGEKMIREIDIAAKLVTAVRDFGNAIGVNFAAVRDLFAWIGPVLTALDASPICDADVDCSTSRSHLARLVNARSDGTLDEITELARQLQSINDGQTLKATVNHLRGALARAGKALHVMGLDQPGGLQANLNTAQHGADRLAVGSRQVADAVEELVGRVKQMGAGLGEASAFLMAMKHDAATPAMAGFNIPHQVLRMQEFKEAAQTFISPDGHSVRYVIQTNLNPFGAEAMDQVTAIADTARGAQPNTTLADASIGLSGYPVTLRDTRACYQHDIRFIVVVTLVVVVLILMALLRAVVAPLYLVGSVVLSYLSAIGIGVVVFQYLLGQQLHWSVPGLAFVVLVAVGADYNMLFVSRMRDESPNGMRYGVIRTLGSTGGVITAAGLIFAASMFGLLFSSIGTAVQAGFVIGVGILLDTFVVRTVTVPAMAALIGRANWWPSRPGRAQ